MRRTSATARGARERATGTALALAFVVLGSPERLGATAASSAAPSASSAAPSAASTTAPGAAPSAAPDAATSPAPTSPAAPVAGDLRSSSPPPPVVALAAVVSAGRDDALAPTLQAGLEARLLVAEAVRLLDPVEVAAAVADLDLAPTRLAEAASARRLARVVGAEAVLSIALRARGARLEARLALVPRAGETRHEVASAASAVELDARVAEATSRLLGISADALAVGALTTDAKAYQRFGRAREAVLDVLGAPAPARRSAAVRRQLAQARSELLAAAELDPGLAPARAAAAVASALLGDKSALREAVERSGAPADLRSVPLAVRAYLEAGDADAAAALLAAAAKAHPWSPAICAARSRLALGRGRFADAAAQLEACRALVPDDVWLLAQRSRALAALGKRDEAISASERARELGGEAPALVGEVAARYLEGGRVDDAIRLLGATLRAQPGAVRLRVLLARAYMLGGRDIDAVTEGERAIKVIDEEDRETRVLAYMTLAHAWARLGQYDVAIEQLAIGRRYGLTSLGEIEADPKLVRFRADPRYPWNK